jgi:Fur family ferric uptake transcriptional regulator
VIHPHDLTPGLKYTQYGNVKNEKAFQFPGEERMLRAISEAGFSDTRARRAVVRALCRSPSRATPADLLKRGRSFYANLGQVTVYRTLDILRGLGLVRRLHIDDGCSYYAESGSGHGHHILCRKCRKAVEFVGCTIEDVLSSAARQTGFEVNGHWLEVFGLCPECRGIHAAPRARDRRRARRARRSEG